jgi:hypothetical protein
MIRRDLSLAFAAAVLIGCGETSGGAAVALGGAAPTLDGVARVYVTLDRVDAYVMDANARTEARTDPSQSSPVQDGWRSVRLPVDRTFDLMRVSDGTIAIGEVDATSGTITQLRMFIDEKGDNRIVLKTGESCMLDLSRIPSTGVMINSTQLPVDFDERHRVRFVVDFDLEDALTRGDPCRFALAPGIQINTISRQGEEAAPTESQTSADAIKTP